MSDLKSIWYHLINIMSKIESCIKHCDNFSILLIESNLNNFISETMPTLPQLWISLFIITRNKRAENIYEEKY